MTPSRATPRLSKSKLMACRQCPKRLWLEWHRPDLRDDSAATQAAFDQGHAVGQVARRLYDRGGRGVEVPRECVKDALAQSKALLRDPSRPLFEVGFETDHNSLPIIAFTIAMYLSHCSPACAVLFSTSDSIISNIIFCFSYSLPNAALSASRNLW